MHPDSEPASRSVPWLTGRGAGMFARPVSPWSPRAFLYAVLCVAVATLLRWGFALLGTQLPFATYFPAILIATLLAGVPAAVFATVASMAVVWWMFVGPQDAAGSPLVRIGIDFALFALSSGCIIAIAHLYEKAVERLRDSERRRSLLLGELEHRRKNAAGIVDAIVRRSLEDDPARAQAIAGRLRALAFTDEAVTSSRTHTIGLRALLAYEFAVVGEDRLDADGPDIDLPPAAARNMALVIHELMTNASKYGALATPGGKVSVRWKRVLGTVTVTWREEGGVPVVAPRRRGFGSRLIAECVKDLSGEVDKEFEPDGLVCRILFCADTDQPPSS